MVFSVVPVCLSKVGAIPKWVKELPDEYRIPLLKRFGRYKGGEKNVCSQTH